MDAFAGVHPRLFLTAERITELKRTIGGTHADIWKMILEKADGYLGKPPPSDYEKQQDMREAGRGIPWQALAFLVSGRIEYLENAKRWVLTICGFPRWQQNNSLSGGECLFGVAIGYDWLFAHFSAEERRLIREKLTLQARAMKDGPPVHYSVWLANHNHVEHTGLAAAGFALFDEIPEAIDWIRQADLVYREFLRQASDDGSSTEGHQYWGYTTESALRYFELARGLLGTNYYDSAWLRRVTQFILHSTLPDFSGQNCVMTFGDAGRSYASHGPTHILYRLAAEYRDRRAQWLALEMDRRRVGRGDFCTWANLLWFDATLQPESWDRSLTHGHSEDIGWVTNRSDWGGDAVMVGFKCGPMHGHKVQRFYQRQFDEKWPRFKWIGGGHGQPDVNSFQIYAYGRWLAIDPGYETPKPTRSHSTLLVNGRGQLGEGTTWFDRETVLAAGASSAFLKVETQSTHDYILGDAKNIYPATAGLTRFHRHFVYVKPDIIVLVDELQGVRGTSIEWLLHTEKEFLKMSPVSYVARNEGVELDVQFLLPTSMQTQASGRTLTLSTVLDGKAQIVTVLHPRKSGGNPIRARLEASGGSNMVVAANVGGRNVQVAFDLASRQAKVRS